MGDGNLVEQGPEDAHGHSGKEYRDRQTMSAVSSEKERQFHIFHHGSNLETDLLNLDDLSKKSHKAGYCNFRG